jgi:O-methyltransferase involved in polyketide biosynthesis
MDTKEIQELQGVQKTLMLPLWGRAVFSKLYPGIMYDKEAVDIVGSWFQDIRYHAADGILFVAGGVFYYFAEDRIKELFITLAKRFPGGELYFEGQTKTALKISSRMVRKSGNQEAVMYFYINNPEIFASWSPLLHLKSAEPYFKNIRRDRRWKISTQMNMLFCDMFRMVCFYHLGFGR